MNVMVKAEKGSTVNVSDIHDVQTVIVGSQAVPAAPHEATVPGREREQMRRVIQSLIDDGLFLEKQDFEALRKIITERGLGGMGYDAFARYLCQEFQIPEPLRPSGNNLKRVVFGQGRFPDWKLPGLNEERRSRFMHIASLFLRGMDLES